MSSIQSDFNVEEHFRRYLATIDPHQTYTIEKLAGGFVNYTVRAIKVPAHDNDRLSKFPGHTSIIIKHAPPFIAAIGEAAKLSPFRQVRLTLARVILPRSLHKSTLDNRLECATYFGIFEG